MESILNEQLKEEELLSGFELLSTDNDSFLLDNDLEYPGKLPYKLSPNEIKDAEASEKLIKEFLEQENQDTEQNGEDRGTVWNLFEEDEAELQKAGQSQDLSDDEDLKLGLNNEAEEHANDVLGINPYDDVVSHNNHRDSSNDLDENELSQKVILQEDENTQIDNYRDSSDQELDSNDSRLEDEEVKFDDDFLSLLQGDLNKSMLKNSDTVKIQNTQTQPDDADFNDFQPVDELDESILIKFDSLGANKPSEFKQNQSKVVSSPTKKLKPISQKKERNQKPKKERKEKKKIVLPILPWRKITFVAATLAIFGGIFLLGYYLFFVDSETQNQLNQLKSFNSKNPDKNADTVKIVSKGDNSRPEKINIQDSSTKIESIPTEEKNPSTEIALKIKDDTKHTEPIKKITILNKRSIPPQYSKPVEKNTNISKGTFNIPEDRLYVVEVFSTPIKEEAEKWLLKLHGQKIFDGVIRTQKVRDDIWYRVRFGNYSSYDEAKAAVLKNGLKNARIDRIK